MPKASRPRALAVVPAASKKAAARPRAQVVRTGQPITLSLPFLIEDPAPGRRLLATALGWSILVHMVVLGLRFVPTDVAKFDRSGPSLEVALVNAKSQSKPTTPEILAQANLDGGGNTDANRRAKTPLAVPPKESANKDLSLATQRVSDLEKRTQELLTQLQATNAVSPVTATTGTVVEVSDLPTASEMTQRTLETMRLEAQIAKQLDAYEKRPKRRFVGARAEEYRFARYIEDWRLKVEGIGNRNYPEAAREQKLYGSLLLTVGIRADGTLESILVDRASGQKILDVAAQKIVEMAAPYAPFPPDIRRDTDILYITRTWTFAPGDSLTSQ
jgi:periplasmic protein TonB